MLPDFLSLVCGGSNEGRNKSRADIDKDASQGAETIYLYRAVSSEGAW